MAIEDLYPQITDISGAVVAVIENATQLTEERWLDGREVVTFSLPQSDPKTSYVIQDANVIWNNRRYIITEADRFERRGDGAIWLNAIAESAATIELTLNLKVGEYTRQTQSLTEIVTDLLADTAWTIDLIEGDPDADYTVSEQNHSVLQFLRTLAAVSDTELVFDSMNRTVSLVDTLGTTYGPIVRYEKNIREIKRSVYAPKATVVYPRGRGGLTIADVNGGVEYIEDFTYYTDQGLSLAEARTLYTKTIVFEDDRFLLGINLLDYATGLLAQWSSPTVAYSAKVLDLSSLSGFDATVLEVGDITGIIDTELGIDADARVVRTRRKPAQPWEDELEFAFAVPTLTETATPASAANNAVNFAVGTNTTAVTIDDTHRTLGAISITAYSSTPLLVGISVTGTVAVADTLNLSTKMNGATIGTTYRQKTIVGDNTNGATFVIPGVDEGAIYLEGIAWTDNDQTYEVDPAAYQIWVLAQNILGGGSDSPPRMSVEEAVTITALLAAPTEIIIAAAQTPQNAGIITENVSAINEAAPTITETVLFTTT